jgi:hypothetical protein
MAEARAPIPIFKKFVLVLPAPCALEKEGAARNAKTKIDDEKNRDRLKGIIEFKWI